jgi:ATP-dependent RNA helicase SUPV3L1/SUV3
MDTPTYGRPTDDYHQQALPPGERRVLAVLGPTNTGKTHLAVERMLGHAKGMIGFPLRLLARENYDKIVKLKGASQVALVTGEEKIIPPRPRYYVCTVESMPLDLEVDFLAVDEIQMAADSERGHIFTERLLRARGRSETMFLGSETARWLIRKLVPECEFITRPRFSTLSYAGHRKVTRLPPRSAIVAFSAAEVYRLAELVRRQRGGTAVVLGALSPRARNAQVGMYQAGEVDYLVATDAIGMGLNMDVRHVAFSALTKYDGNRMRDLAAGEIGQIAGRAGRHMSDGTFGTTADLQGMDEDVVQRVESHDFETLRSLMWRNADLDFRTVAGLLRTLEEKPPHPFLRRARRADDHRTLESLAQMPDVASRALGKTAVQLLWDVCQVPDFSKTLTDSHTRLLARIFAFRSEGEGRLPTDWVASHIKRLERTDGDIDTLMARIAGTRTWTYISHRTGWLDDPAHWQEQALAIEDKLSDALHDRLTQRFVDRRTAVLVRRLADGDELIGGVNATGEVVVEGETVGTLSGFRFKADTADRGEDGRALLNAANRVLRQEIDGRVAQVAQAEHKDFRLDEHGRITWAGEPLGALVKGSDWLKPRAEPLASALLDSRHRQALRVRLQDWLDQEVQRRLGPLARLRAMDGSPALRGIGYRLAEDAGVLERRAVRDQVQALTKAERKQLGAEGLRIGREHLFLPQLMRGAANRWRLSLWRLHHGGEPPPAERAPVLAVAEDADAAWYRICGYTLVGRHAIRVDRWEAFAAAAHKEAATPEGLTASASLAAAAGVETETVPALLRRLRFFPTGSTSEAGEPLYRHKNRLRRKPGSDGGKTAKNTAPNRRRKRPPNQAPAEKRPAASPDSPFAGLRIAMALAAAS